MVCPEPRTPPDPRGKDAIPEKHQGHSDKPACRVWPWRFSSRPASIQSLGKLPRISWDFHPDRDRTCPRLRLIHCTLPFGRCSLTPELSRPAARRQSSTNIPEKFAAVKQGRLGRIVRPAPDVFADTAASMANPPLERLDDMDQIPAVRSSTRSEFASLAATGRGVRSHGGTCGTCVDSVLA